MKNEIPSHLENFDEDDVTKEFIEQRLKPMLEDFLDTVEKALSGKNQTERFDLLNDLRDAAKDGSRRLDLLEPLMTMAKKYNDKSKENFKNIFLDSKETPQMLYNELLQMELMLREKMGLPEEKIESKSFLDKAA